MLISHTKRFIYLKTVKTAGTSVEIFFERYCRPADAGDTEKGGTPELVSKEGIVGYRGPDAGNSTWYNHMPAAEVKKLVDDNVWSDYFKFCVVRNPFDKMVSYWWMLGVGDAADKAKGDLAFAREHFSRWLLSHPNLSVDQKIYTIAGKPVVDDFIRYEDLPGGITRVCERIGVPADVERLGRYKGQHRQRSESYRDYYTPEARRRVEKDLAVDIERFGYTF